MEALKPLTISNSIGNEPTKLLTKDLAIYLLYKPINEHTVTQVNVLDYLLNHFKVNHNKSAYFDFKGKRYLCLEQRPESHSFFAFYHHLWTSKKSFNQFLNPEELMKIAILNLLFPIFNSNLKVNIVNDRKYIFSASYDTLSFTEPIQFTPISINQSILSKPEIKKFISFKKREMHELVEAFEILHHDKLFADLKYQVSMSSSLRNSYWDELKKCLNADYKNYVFSTVKDYLMRI